MTGKQNDAMIRYFGLLARVKCDRMCHKAWGMNNRPYEQLSNDPDDIVFLADDELGDAPVDPGTYEGLEKSGKPLSPDEFPTRWCVRECERSEMSPPGKIDEPVKLTDWGGRVYNQPWRHGREV